MSGYIPTLDGWRAIAILMVLVDHALFFGFRASRVALWPVPPALGLHGVNLFFALSGFLITSRLLEEWRVTGAISLRGFYIRRAFRILPAALLVLAATATLGLVGLIPVSRMEVLGAVFFFRNYLPGASYPDATGFFTEHYWSLAVEEHFYLAWPALLLLTLRKRWAPWTTTGVLHRHPRNGHAEDFRCPRRT